MKQVRKDDPVYLAGRLLEIRRKMSEMKELEGKVIERLDKVMVDGKPVEFYDVTTDRDMVLRRIEKETIVLKDNKTILKALGLEKFMQVAKVQIGQLRKEASKKQLKSFVAKTKTYFSYVFGNEEDEQQS